MRNKILTGTLALMSLLWTVQSFTQTIDEGLHRTYWNYRDIFKKYFISLGTSRGQSLVSDRINNTENIHVKCNLNKIDQNKIVTPYLGPTLEYWGYVNYGDVALDFDYYIGTLATEYWLLKHYKQDRDALESVKNRIVLCNKCDRQIR